MPKISVYLPDDLYQEARARQLPLSSIARRAVEQALAAARTREWVDRVRRRAPRCQRRVDTGGLLDSVREEFGR